MRFHALNGGPIELRAAQVLAAATVGAALALAAAPARGDHVAAHATPCNEAETVGGGALGVSPGPVGPPDSLGWDVGNGQCNGSFTVTRDASFASPDGDGIELGLRAEQRSVGQVANSGGDYLVQTGADPTNAARAWWNFQPSIAYDGGIADLDELTLAIRTDAGNSVPAGAADLLTMSIDARNNQPNPTGTYSDLYQASQNPTFGWFTSYDMTEEGAWTLTLAARKGADLAGVSICIHTLGEACDAPPAVYGCAGSEAGAFFPPADKDIRVRQQNRVIPLQMACTDGAGNALGSADIAPPVLVVTKQPAGPATTGNAPFLHSGLGTDANEFVFRGGRWHFNLSLKNFTGSGMYEISAIAGGTDLLLGAPVATLIIQ